VVEAQQPASASREEIERLALIRYQLDLALRQAEQAHPLNGFSVLGFHDAVEWFLYLAAEHLRIERIETRRGEFDGYYEAVSNNMPDGDSLGYKRPLTELNKARVNIKHYGNLPDQSTIERHRATALAFLDDATLRLFGVSFGSISVSHLIQDEKVRQHVEHAEEAWRTGDARAAMRELRLGFDHSIRDLLIRFLPSGRIMGLPYEKKRELSPVVSRLDALDHAVALLSLGIDLRRYYFFRAHTPAVHLLLGGGTVVDHIGDVNVDQNTFSSCHQFVIDTALQVAEALH
jgi:hypothetical protein